MPDEELVVNETPATLYPPLPDTVPGGIDEGVADPSLLIETICGASTDWQPVEQYDGRLGVAIPFVAQRQAPVGQIQWNFGLGNTYNNPGNVAGQRWCTGTLVADDLFLTAGHCFDVVDAQNGWQAPKDNTTNQPISSPEIARNMHVNFNFQVDASGNPRQEQVFPIAALEEYRQGELDYAVVRLEGQPGATFGTTKVGTRDAELNTVLCIIQHPAGIMKVVEAGPVSRLAGHQIGYNDLDTVGGSSGAGVLSESMQCIVGVHVLGGCGPSIAVGHNHGVRITSILQHSPILRGLTTS